MKNVLIIAFIWIAGSIYFNSCDTKKKTIDTVDHTTESNSTENNNTHTLHTSTSLSEENSTIKKSDINKSTSVENNLTLNSQEIRDSNLTVSVAPLSLITTDKEVLTIETNKTLPIGTKIQHSNDETHSVEASQIKDHTSLVSESTKDIDNNHTIIITGSDHNIIIPHTIKSQKETKEILSIEENISKNIHKISTVSIPENDNIPKALGLSSPNRLVTEAEMNTSTPIEDSKETIHTSTSLTKNTKVIDTVGITNTIQVPHVMKVPQAVKPPHAITVTTLHKDKNKVLSLVYGTVKDTPKNTNESTKKILEEKVVIDNSDYEIKRLRKTKERLKLNIEEIKRTATHEKSEAIRLTKEKYEAQKIIDTKKVEEETKRLNLLHTTDVEKLSEEQSKFQLFRKEKEQTIKDNHDKFTALQLVKNTLETEKNKLTQKALEDTKVLREENTKLQAKIKELQKDTEQKQSQETLALATQKEALIAEAKRIKEKKVELERLRNSEKEEITKLKMLHATDVQRLVEEESRNKLTAQKNNQTIKDNLKKVAALMLVKNALEKEKTEALNFKQNTQKDINTLNQENTKLHAKIKELQINAQEKERLTKITKETESKIKRVSQENEKLKELILTLKKKKAKQEATMAEKQSQEAKQLAAQKATLETETKHIAVEKANIKELLAYIKKEKTQLKTLQAKEIQTFTDEKAKYAQEYQEKEKTIKDNLAKISTLMSSYTQVEEEKNKALTLKQKFAIQLETAQKEKASLTTKAHTLIVQNKKLTQQVKDLKLQDKKELERLTALKTTLDKESQEINKSKSELERLRNTEDKEYKIERQKKEQIIKDNLAKLTALMLVKDKLELEKTKALQAKNESITQYNVEHEEKQKVQEQAKVLTDKNTKLQAMIEELQINTKTETSRLAEENSAQVATIQQTQAEIKRITEEKLLLEEKIKVQKEAQEKEKIATEAKEKLFNIFALTQVKFKTSSPELTDDSKNLLNEAANAIKEHTEFNYEIHGHTDSRGNEDKNLELSINRAKSVKEYLINQGVDATILKAKGFGATQPITSNNTKEGRLRNRRVVFKIIRQ